MGRVPSSSYQVTSRQAVRRHLENRQLNAMTRGQSQQGSGSPSGSDTLTIPAISFSAHGLDHSGCLDEFAVFGGGVLAAAIGMVDQALRRLLPLDGHGQGRGGQFRPHVITHRPANNLPGARIEHGRQGEPAFIAWHIGDAGEPDLIGPFDSKIAVEPIGGKMDTSDISDVLKWANRDGCPWGGPGTAAVRLPSCVGGA